MSARADHPASRTPRGGPALRTASAQIWLEGNGIVQLEPIARREQTLRDAIENVEAVGRIFEHGESKIPARRRP